MGLGIEVKVVFGVTLGFSGAEGLVYNYLKTQGVKLLGCYEPQPVCDGVYLEKITTNGWDEKKRGKLEWVVYTKNVWFDVCSVDNPVELSGVIPPDNDDTLLRGLTIILGDVTVAEIYAGKARCMAIKELSIW